MGFIMIHTLEKIIENDEIQNQEECWDDLKIFSGCRNTPFLSISKGVFRFNSSFTTTYKYSVKKYVKMCYSKSNDEILLFFYDKKEENSYKLTLNKSNFLQFKPNYNFKEFGIDLDNINGRHSIYLRISNLGEFFICNLSHQNTPNS